MTYLAFDGVICKDIKQLVEDFKPGQVAEEQKTEVSVLLTELPQSVVCLWLAGMSGCVIGLPKNRYYFLFFIKHAYAVNIFDK